MESISDICETKIPNTECNDSLAVKQCKTILSDKFAACHLLIEPENYMKACVIDMCNSIDPPASLCRSLTGYARKCAEVGICLENWRSNELCPAHCSEGMHFEQCKSPCMVTCETKDMDITLNKECMIRTPVDGCVCNGNLVLKDGICVDPFMCDTCDEEGHMIGDTWKPNSCVECRCTPKLRIECFNTEICPPSPICNKGEILVTLPATNNTCCPHDICKKNITTECNAMDIPECPEGEVGNPTRDKNGCINYECTCDVLQCKPISEPSKIDIGEQVVLNTEGCCPVKEIVCLPETCPEKPKCRPPRKLVEKISTKKKCCPEFDCELHDQCSYSADFIIENGIEKFEPNQPEETYKPRDIWLDGNCAICSCEGSPGHYEAKCDYQACSSSNLKDDYVLETVIIPYACCPEYKKLLCKDDENNNHTVGDSWPVPGDKCSSYLCLSESPHGEVKKIKTTISCNTDCQANEIYEEPSSESNECCGRCKPVACLGDDGNVHQVGEKWATTLNKCYQVVCEELQSQGTVSTYTHKHCPPLPAYCPEENIERDEDDCCDICTAPPEFCQPQNVNLTDTKRIFEVVHKGVLCTNKKPIEKLTECSGKCESQTIYSAGKKDYFSSCSCCTPLESEDREIELDCVDGSSYPFSFQQPLSCSCTPCTGGEQTNLELPKQLQR